MTSGPLATENEVLELNKHTSLTLNYKMQNANVYRNSFCFQSLGLEKYNSYVAPLGLKIHIQYSMPMRSFLF